MDFQRIESNKQEFLTTKLLVDNILIVWRYPFAEQLGKPTSFAVVTTKNSWHITQSLPLRSILNGLNTP